MSASPLVSVIVLFDRGRFEPCLASLLAQEGVEFEIIAVAPDEITALAAPRNERVIALTIGNRNPAFRRNAAAGRARGRYLAFIDDDASAPPGWLHHAVSFLERNPVYAGVGGPNLCPEDAGVRERISDMLLTAPLIGGGSRAYRGGGLAGPARPGEVHLVNFMVRRDWFDRVNGFNEEMGYGAEDTEFLHLAGRFGARFMFDPSLTVHHCRRPFGFAYFQQRFRLRRQSALLSLAYPGVYLSNPAFVAAVLAPFMLLALFFLWPFWRSGAGIVLLVLAYALLTVSLSSRSWRKRPVLLVIAPFAFFLHHLVYECGLWWGFLGAVLTGPRRARRKLRRKVDSCGMQ